jgi:hypothetical protein
MSRPFRVVIASALLLVGSASAVWAAKEPPKPAAVPPEVSLALTAGSAGWTLEVANLGAVPMRLEADARLLRLEIAALTTAASASASASASPKGKPAPKPPAPTVCELPASMRLEGRTLVLQPGQRYAETFDPRLFCLDAIAKLDAGARVTATLGWPAGKGALAAPFVVAPFVSAPAPSSSASASAGPRIASAKEIAAPPIVIAPRVVASAAAPSASSAAVPKPAAPKPVLVAKGGSGRSIYDGKDAAVTIVVTNESPTAQTVYARPQVIGVVVRGPRGERTRCEPGFVPAPIVDFVVHIAPGGVWTSETRIDGICPQGTFDRPGIYELWPVLHAPALPWQASAFRGDVHSSAPQLVRVETGKLPFHDAAPRALASASASARP